MRHERGEESTGGEMRGAESRREEGGEMEGRAAEPAEGVLTLVCLKCGKEYFFVDQPPPGAMICEKCGSTVFRDFYTGGGEAGEDFRDSTDRDLRTDDPEGDTLPGDLIDLNREG